MKILSYGLTLIYSSLHRIVHSITYGALFPQAQQATSESSSGLTGGAVCSLDARKRKNLQKEMDDQLAAAGGDREVTTTANMESSSSSAASADDQVHIKPGTFKM